MEGAGGRVAVETTGVARSGTICRASRRSRSSPTGRLRSRESGGFFTRPSKRRPGKGQNRRIPFGKGRKQPRCMRCWAARREQRGARSNSSPAGNGTACEASCRRACGNKGTSCACSCAPASACTGPKAELFPQGAEALFLPFPVRQARHRTKMAFEQRIRTAPGGRKKEQLFLNLRREMIQLQDLAESGAAHLPGLGQFPTISDRAF